MASASSKSESDVETSDEHDPVSMPLREGTGDQSALHGQASQELLNAEELKCMGRIQFNEDQSETLDTDCGKELEITQLIFRLLRGPAIKLFRSAIKSLLEKMSPPLDADIATLEDLCQADGRFSMEDIKKKHFKETFEHLERASGDDDTPECSERRCKEITLVSKDVCFYAKIIEVFFEDIRCPALKNIVHLRNKVLHYKKDKVELTSEMVHNALIEAEHEVNNLTIWNRFPPKPKLICSAREETAALNKLRNNHNVFTWMQHLHASESIKSFKFSDVFVPPLMLFKGQPLDDLSKVFTHEEAMGVCTGLRAILLSGPCGVGKSALAYNLVQRWLDSSSPHLVQFEIIFLVDLHRARHSDILSYIQDSMPLTAKKLSTDNFIQCFSDLKVLLVVDGFDARYQRRVHLLKDICDKFRRSTALIITTNDSLSTAQHCFDSVGDGCRSVVTVIGFDSERCEAFATKVLAAVVVDDQRNKLREKFELVLNHRRNLFPGQRESPLVASLIMSILLMNPNMSEEWFESTPKLCHTLFFYLRDRPNFPHSEHPPDESLDDRFLLRLGEICFRELQSDGRLAILLEDKKVLGVPEDDSLPLCLLKHKMGDSFDADHSFCTTLFMHYLAAVYLISEVKIRKGNLHSYSEHDTRLFKELLPFLVRDSYLLEKCSEDIFNIAKNVTSRTSSDDTYSIWFGIVSQVDRNSSNSFRERVTQVLPSFEWSLNKETLVPAAGLLKFCEPGITQELKINLAGSDSSSNGLLMHHLHECLQENYSNGEAEILLSLDLGLPDVEESCTWLAVLDEPFCVVDFTAHVDAESVSMLREYQQLSSVTLRLSSLASFNKFAECYEFWQNIKTVKMHVCFLDSLSEILDEQVKRLSNKELSLFELIFDGFESRVLNKFFKLLLDILPSDQKFFKIILSNTTLTFNDARKLLSTKFFRDGRLVVKSTCSLSPAEKDLLKAETFRYKWPLFQFSWNGRHW